MTFTSCNLPSKLTFKTDIVKVIALRNFRGYGTAYAALTVLFIPNFNWKRSKFQKIDYMFRALTPYQVKLIHRFLFLKLELFPPLGQRFTLA